MAQKDPLPMEPVWRFYLDEQEGWKWQRIGGDLTVIAESEIGWGNYESCLEDAKRQGYEFQPSQSAGPKGPSDRTWWY
ncbi:MAG: hypothetical protein IT488_13795 [Gammaproteobacteria bacterium]|nr:hypothetical protein [Gammaproteobacteria bacterium]